MLHSLTRYFAIMALGFLSGFGLASCVSPCRSDAKKCCDCVNDRGCLIGSEDDCVDQFEEEGKVLASAWCDHSDCDDACKQARESCDD